MCRVVRPKPFAPAVSIGSGVSDSFLAAEKFPGQIVEVPHGLLRLRGAASPFHGDGWRVLRAHDLATFRERALCFRWIIHRAPLVRKLFPHHHRTGAEIRT